MLLHHRCKVYSFLVIKNVLETQCFDFTVLINILFLCMLFFTTCPFWILKQKNYRVFLSLITDIAFFSCLLCCLHSYFIVLYVWWPAIKLSKLKTWQLDNRCGCHAWFFLVKLLTNLVPPSKQYPKRRCITPIMEDYEWCSLISKPLMITGHKINSSSCGI